MERNNDNYNTESLVRKLTEERERFVSAWQHGAGSTELNNIRQNIQQLNDLLWNASVAGDRFSQDQRPVRENERDFQTRTGPNRNR